MNSMAADQRSSRRTVKPRRDPDFVYETEGVNFWSRSRRQEEQQNSPGSDSSAITTNLAGKVTSQSVSWSDIDFTQNFDTENINIELLSREYSELVKYQQLSFYQGTELQEKEEERTEYFVNKTSSCRKTSSTRYDFIDIDNCFLSVSSAFNTNTSDMSGDSSQGDMENRAVKVSEQVEGACGTSTSKDSKSHQDDFDALIEAVKKIDVLSDTVKRLEKTIVKQGQRLERMEESAKSSSGESKSRYKGKKEDRVESEKKRQLKVLQDKLKDKSREVSVDSDISSDDRVDLKSIKKKLTRKQRDLCSSKVAAKLKDVGATFPEDDFSTTSTSGKDTESEKGSCRHSNKVKSGAKVKKRPVVKTLLWPHTIANEDDGDEVTSENISLSKFFSCFTSIMTSCGGVESRGRSALLHAVSLVLEYVQWPDARTFHNLVMVKLEQDRLNWASDFSALAEAFIDKKVRLGLRSKYASSASSTYSKSSNYAKGFNKGFKGQGQRNSAGRGKPMYGVICWQWNYSSCTYGEDCKRWHVCKACAEAGKLGESHKASSHDSSGSRTRPRV